MTTARARLLAPWLRVVHLAGAGDDGQDAIEVSCTFCRQMTRATIDNEGKWFQNMTLYFEHAGDCIVPWNLARANVARWN